MALVQEILAAKRDNQVLSDEDIETFIAGVADGSIPDYQSSAMLMAVFLNGLSDAELSTWTTAMLNSGHKFERGSYGRPAVDKHSTGGVGDKLSLPLGPAVAACGLAVPMISGRGLGHTGGTLDKLEAIPGLTVAIGPDEFVSQVRDIGIAIVGQTENIVPADRTLYSLRDATATVASVPLIASSIMSKKLAEGIDSLIIDLKVGPAAFMQRIEDGRELAAAMQAIGARANTPTTIMMTRMDAPIGTMVGNANEIAETVDVLKGAGPAETRDMVIAIGAEMLVMGQIATSVDDGAERVAKALDDGSGAEVFGQMVERQGGDRRVVDSPWDVMATASQQTEFKASRSGYVDTIEATNVGLAALELGGGRRVKTDVIVPSVGIEMTSRLGDKVEEGDVLAIIHHEGQGLDDAQARLNTAFNIGDSAVQVSDSRVLEVLRPE